VFLGVAVLGPILARPLSRVLGSPLPHLKGMSGTLARENAMRNPKRTSATASALMIGVALVGFITILASSTKASIADSVDTAFAGDLVIDSGTYTGGGLSPRLADDLSTLPEVDAVAGLRNVVRWKDGGEPLWDVLNRDQIMKRRNRSPAANARSSPWLTDFVAMSQKTGVRAIAKWAPSATERDTLSRAVAYEQAHELGRPSQAVAALGMPAMSAMDSMGAMPQDDPVPVNADGEVLDGELVNGERQPGED
jgi:hypothetical protein